MMNNRGNAFCLPSDGCYQEEFSDPKKDCSFHRRSLFSMAMYEYEYEMTNAAVKHANAMQNYVASFPPPAPVKSTSGVFHPIEEYKDCSLKQILEIADDFILDEDDFGGFNPESQPMPDFACSTSSDIAHIPVKPSEVHQDLFVDLSDTFDRENVESPESQPAQTAPQVSLADAKGLEPNEGSSPKKRTRSEMLEEQEEHLSDEERSRRFRPYQACQWSEKFAELCAYRKEIGHCLVPHSYTKNLPLARWVKRQRYQHKLFKDGKASTMTPERVKALDEIGFVWDSQGAAWGERFDELKEFRQLYKHCNVPSNYSENPQLATWVKCQRRQYKLYMEGKPSNITATRIDDLESIGFEWELRPLKKLH